VRHSAPTGTIVGGVVGGVAALALAGLLIWWYSKRTRSGHSHSKEDYAMGDADWDPAAGLATGAAVSHGMSRRRSGGATGGGGAYAPADGAGTWGKASAARQQDAYYAYYAGAQEVTPSEYGEGVGGLAGVGTGAAGLGAGSRASHGSQGHADGGGGAAGSLGEHNYGQAQGSLEQDYQSPARLGGPGGPGAGLAAWAEEEDPYGGIADDGSYQSPQPQQHVVGTGHARSYSGGSSKQRSQYAPSSHPTTSPCVPVPPFNAAQHAPSPVPSSLQPGGGGGGYHLPGVAPHDALTAPGDGRFGDHGPLPLPGSVNGTGASPAPSHRSISALAAWSGSGALSDEMDRPRQGPLRVVNSDEGDHK